MYRVVSLLPEEVERVLVHAHEAVELWTGLIEGRDPREIHAHEILGSQPLRAEFSECGVTGMSQTLVRGGLRQVFAKPTQSAPRRESEWATDVGSCFSLAFRR